MTNINKLAKEAIFLSRGHSFLHTKLMFCFQEGYKAAIQWHPMEEAPKDGTKIMVAFKTKDGKIDITTSYYLHSAFGGDWVMDELDDLLAWTHLPIYKKEK